MEKVTNLGLKESEGRNIIPEDVESGVSGGISQKKADEIYREKPETRGEEVAKLRKMAIDSVETAQIEKETVNENILPMGIDLPPGTPAIFQKLPEIFTQVKELIDSINGDVRGVKKLTSFFTRGYSKDVLELAEKGARKVLANDTKMAIYNKAFKEGGPNLAWEYVQESANNDFLDIVGGKITDRAIKKSIDFRGSSSE